ncbi:class II fructose-bisphosphate aldolase family protein [Glaciihabitans sp. INWT7]|uniref:class II fructose-bisphosphate aldolase n=1 Tax=Glaciihabitans sp. INWT7 TaxID=2596912 RepID=UPI0016263BED|nr:class II fructose-bisphosphate aldolase [Glaciihabitans sp. INWT7]QNE45522.1 class II fructose-bisphosphate aldolase family protein [Glaciihabitans sp. INWT7]
MTLSATRALVDDAIAGGRAVPSFNVISLEHAEAIVAGADLAGIGVLLQLSENAVKYHGGMRPMLAACRELATSARSPIGIHLDHFEAASLIDEAIALGAGFGLGSLMVDASTEPYERNVALTASAASRGRAAGLWIEAELGKVGGKDGAHAPGVRTDPSEAARFVDATGVDGLAVAVGSSHAMTEQTASLDLDLIARLAEAVDVPLVLHGSSGVPDAVLREAVAAGIRKVNVGTGLNRAFTAEVRAVLDAAPALTDPRRYLAPARDRVSELVAHLCGVIAG